MRHRSAEWLACIMLMPCVALAQQGATRAEPAARPAPSAASAGATAASKSAPSAGASRAAESRDAEPAVDTSRRADTAAAADAKPRTAAGARHAADSRHPSGTAMDHLQLGTTDITGNRELPKVMVIVPWKSSNLGDLTGKPLDSLVDEALQPVDRDVFRRENRYYRAVTRGASHDADRSPDGGGGSAVRDER